MAKKKIHRFAELDSFPNVFRYLFYERKDDFKLKGKWNSGYFQNTNPIVLELGCGKGEYTAGMAEKFPEKNFIGVDIKGARIWRGAKTALEKNLSNAVFLRSQVDFIEQCFSRNEVSDIWLPFPDPQPKKARKRLTHPLFLNRYQNILHPDGSIHLKTDNAELYEFTLEVIRKNKLHLLHQTDDLYQNSKAFAENVTGIKTFYEKRFLEEGKKIYYLCFAF